MYNVHNHFPFLFEQPDFVPTPCHFNAAGQYVCLPQQQTKPKTKTQSDIEKFSPTAFDTVVQYRDHMLLDNNEDASLFKNVKPSYTSSPQQKQLTSANGGAPPSWMSYDMVYSGKRTKLGSVVGVEEGFTSGALENQASHPMDLDSAFAPPTPRIWEESGKKCSKRQR